MSFTPDVAKGRGAWKTTGKPNGSTNYTFRPQTDGKPEVDGRLLTDDNFRAIHHTVRFLQRKWGVPTPKIDGRLGPGTSRDFLIPWQGRNGLNPDGFFGRISARHLLRQVIAATAEDVGVRGEGKYLFGTVLTESAADPGAVSDLGSGFDCGWSQINLKAHGPGTRDNFSMAQVFDGDWAIRYNAERFARAWNQFSAKGKALQLRCAILEHNSPVNARRLYDTGEYPTEQARTYVQKVLAEAEAF